MHVQKRVQKRICASRISPNQPVTASRIVLFGSLLTSGIPGV